MLLIDILIDKISAGGEDYPKVIPNQAEIKTKSTVIIDLVNE